MKFRITVGLTGIVPKEWAGRVSVTGGDLVQLDGWRFSQGDRAGADGSFRFVNKFGPFEPQQLLPQGLMVKVRGDGQTRTRFDSPAGAFEFTAGSAPYHTRLSVLDGNGRVERVPVDTRLGEPRSEDDSPWLTVTPGGQKFAAWLTREDMGNWVVVEEGGKAVRVTDKGDHQNPSVVVDKQGWVYVAYSAREGNDWHVYLTVRAYDRWIPARQMSAGSGSHVSPRLVAEPGGQMALVWQLMQDERSSITLRRFDGRRWGAAETVSAPDSSAWAPAATFAGKDLWLAWDAYADGAFQVFARRYADQPGPIQQITKGPEYSVRASIAVSPAGVPVAAWEESDSTAVADARLLLNLRLPSPTRTTRIRLAYLAGASWQELAGPVAESLPSEARRSFGQAQVGFDAGGRLYLLFRARTAAMTGRTDWASTDRWETFVTRRAGDDWLPAVVMPSSAGRSTMRAHLTFASGKVMIVWPTDQREWPGAAYAPSEVRGAAIPVEGAPTVFSKVQ